MSINHSKAVTKVVLGNRVVDVEGFVSGVRTDNGETRQGFLVFNEARACATSHTLVLQFTDTVQAERLIQALTLLTASMRQNGVIRSRFGEDSSASTVQTQVREMPCFIDDRHTAPSTYLAIQDPKSSERS